MALELLAPPFLLLASALVLWRIPHLSFFFSIAFFLSVVMAPPLWRSLIACFTPGLLLLCYSARAMRTGEIKPTFYPLLHSLWNEKIVKDERKPIRFTTFLVLYILIAKGLLLFGALLYWSQNLVAK